MSQNPDQPRRESTDEEKDFESGLDYGAFASDEPDFPEDHDLTPGGQKAASDDAGTAATDAASVSQSEGTGAASSGTGSPSTTDAAQPGSPSPEASQPAESQTAASGSGSGETVTSQSDGETSAPSADEGTGPAVMGTPAASGSQPPGPRGAADEQETTVVPAAGEQRTRSLSEELAAQERFSGVSPAAGTAATTAVGTAAVTGAGTTSSDAASGTSAQAAAQPVHGQPTQTLSKKEQKKAEKKAAKERKRAEKEAKKSGGAASSEQGPATYGNYPAAPAGYPRENEEITDADIDEEVAKSKRGISRFLQVLVAIFFPVLLIVAAVRLVGTPAFLMGVYRRPGFPEDDFGFSLADRILYGSYGMDYLFNGANSRYLAELAPGGEALFTTDEVSHMTDVKLVMWYVMLGGLVLLLLTLILMWMIKAWRPGGVARALFAGAWVTIGMAAAVAVLAILDWNQFFNQFHEIFFPQGNWQFASDSTLIRLYPAQFWVDAGITIGVLVLLAAIITLIATWPTKRRRARRQARLEEVQDRRREKLIRELNKDAEVQASH
ncbi:lipoprotein intramolecular transacylase Lit [Nesterenkonia flava]|uniref:DUF1461 domain-containing protein n=1 Tax=Nesterenkonia flava TaxID=469799 RepID=A0ABU1FQ57_9MICC|nr:DUF1461 domain-containing protein [Nesterenkonia flava]MDR5710780.1 DUF1461 domain-containing protein [Nesterenkonia flava]